MIEINSITLIKLFKKLRVCLINLSSNFGNIYKFKINLILLTKFINFFDTIYYIIESYKKHSKRVQEKESVQYHV